MSEVESVKIEKIPWITVGLSTILLTLISTIVTPLWRPPLYNVYGLGGSAYLAAFISAPIIMIALFAFLEKISPSLRTRIDKSYIVYVYTGVIVATSITQTCRWSEALYKPLNHRIGLNRFIPSFWAPSAEYLKTVMTGGPFILSEWLPFIVFWSVFSIGVYLFFQSIINIFRYTWIDVESMPFPHAQIALELISSLHERTDEKARTRKFLILGLILGLAFYTPNMLNTFFPAFPDIYGWTNSYLYVTWSPGTLQLPRAFPGLASSIVGLSCFNWNPILIAITYYAPLNTLLSAVIFYLLFWYILPQIAYYSGYYTGILSIMDGSTREYYIGRYDPFKNYVLLTFGVMFGLAVFSTIFNWKRLATTIKLAINRGSEKEIELEKREPIPYKYTYAMLIGSSLLLIAMFMASEISIVPSVTLLVLLFLNTISLTRMRGLVGIQPSGVVHGRGLFRWIWPNMTAETVTQEYILTNSFAAWEFSCTGNYPDQAFAIGDTFRIAATTNVNIKNLFKVQMFAGIVAPIVVTVGTAYMAAVYGWRKMGTPGSDVFIPSTMYADAAINWPGPEPIWQHAILGFLLCGGLLYLHSRYTWFFLDPVGLAVTSLGPRHFMGAIAVAWVLKFITLKIGGTKLYSEKGVPIVTGFILGFALMSLPATILYLIFLVRPF